MPARLAQSTSDSLSPPCSWRRGFGPLLPDAVAVRSGPEIAARRPPHRRQRAFPSRYATRQERQNTTPRRPSCKIWAAALAK
jgi:hypothetical protein